MDTNEIPQGEIAAELAADLDLIEHSNVPLDAKALDLIDDARIVATYMADPRYPNKNPELIRSSAQLVQRVRNLLSPQPRHLHLVGQAA